MLFIIVTTYNRENYISRALDSLYRQSNKDFYVIVVDDGSTDQTKNLIDKYSSKHKNIKYHYQENQGVCAAKQKGIDIAITLSLNIKGDYYSFLDSDDEYLDYAIDTIKKEIEYHNKVSCIFFGMIDNFGTINVYDKLAVIKLSLLKNPYYHYEREIRWGDGILYEKIVNTKSFLISDIIVYKAYINNISMTRGNQTLVDITHLLKADIRRLELFEVYYQKNGKNLNLAVIYYRLAKYYGLIGNKKKAWFFMKKGIKSYKNFKLILLNVIGLLPFAFFINNLLIKIWKLTRSLLN